MDWHTAFALLVGCMTMSLCVGDHVTRAVRRKASSKAWAAMSLGRHELQS